MKLAVFAFTRKGCRLALRCRDALMPEDCRMVTMEKFGFAGFEAYSPPLSGCMKPYFSWADQILFIGSTGMAVRAIAPWVTDKKQDPGVLVVDEGGTFVVSLLSGHIGGANALTRKIAEALHATAVITTATDINRRFSVDTWATEHGCTISSMKLAKAVSAAILERDISLKSDFPIAETLPNGVISGATGNIGIYLTVTDKEPFENTLRLIPKVLHLGIGCRRGIEKEAVERAVAQVFQENGLDFRAVKCAASIDLKQNEEGLLSFCQEHNIPITFYTAEKLKDLPGDFTPSPFVQKVTGVDNVC